MASKAQRIVVAADGSPSSKAAVETVSKLPWAKTTRARVVVARFPWLRSESQAAQEALARDVDAAAAAARRQLAHRWPDADIAIVDEPPLDAVLHEAERFDATLIALGWRGHGTFRRLIAGSVSRAVAARANCSVLVVNKAPRAIRRFVLGYDGCPNAERAIDFLASLEPARAMKAVLVNVLQPISTPPSVARLPRSTRAQLREEVRALNEERYLAAQAILDSAVKRLRDARWTVTKEVRLGAPVAGLLKAADEHGADAVIVGARATSGLERALLGSVANAVLNRSRVPVLLVR